MISVRYSYGGPWRRKAQSLARKRLSWACYLGKIEPTMGTFMANQ